MKLFISINDKKGDEHMNIRYLKVLGLVIPFFLLLQGCSFYARLGAVKQSEQTNATAHTEEKGNISTSENGQVQAAFTKR